MKTLALLLPLSLVCPLFAEEDSPAFAKLKVMQRLVGTWSGPFTSDSGEKMECTCDLSWAPTKHAIVWTYAEWPAGSQGKISLRANGIIYWDPGTGKITERGVTADGLVITTFFHAEGDQIIGDRSAVDLKGETTTSTESWTFTDDTWRFLTFRQSRCDSYLNFPLKEPRKASSSAPTETRCSCSAPTLTTSWYTTWISASSPANRLSYTPDTPLRRWEFAGEDVERDCYLMAAHDTSSRQRMASCHGFAVSVTRAVPA